MTGISTSVHAEQTADLAAENEALHVENTKLLSDANKMRDLLQWFEKEYIRRDGSMADLAVNFKRGIDNAFSTMEIIKRHATAS